MGASLKDIRKKIASVKNTQKTTRAMKLVSTSKLKKTEEVAKRSRVFAQKLNEVVGDICAKIKARNVKGIESKYFADLERNTIQKIDIIFVTADKGLCGGFNMTTIKEVLRYINLYRTQGIKVRLRGIGKKGVAYFTYNGVDLLDKATDLSSAPDYERASAFIDKAVQDYLNGLTDSVLIVHNGFKNMISQELRMQQVLPLDFAQKAMQEQDGIVVEPDDEEGIILDALAKKFIDFNMYYALLDSLAAEHSARMQAMDTATNNAADLVRTLTISYNKARQEAITTELVEINAGVEAIK
ncbi:ATP synthase F1 subunit gamma [Helicobacter felis]|uniref:ATP synthase gamma chain n=1 Tax=Helicobacter felis (strain ATCC 49179 / CCUG 28539 / NCTC 12436 / CS1) TaxID=936155 RepID=E7AAM9_HELFC|nr:ATP synthase F1 subunit gamma [Helicobacter felis]CBY83549.1 ATP synthase F1 sector gamma subunit [Helicobacter felis ATCC 49179]